MLVPILKVHATLEEVLWSKLQPLENKGEDKSTVVHIGVHEYLLKKYANYNGRLSHSSIYKRRKGCTREYNAAKR